MVTLVRTHDDARDLIRECAGGLLVRFERVQHGESARRYRLVHPLLQSRDLGVVDTYNLPFLPERVAAHVKGIAERSATDLHLQLSCNRIPAP